MKRLSLKVVLLIIIPLVFSCSRGAVKEQAPPRDQYGEALKLYEDGKYFKAQTQLQRIIYSYPGQTFIDTAQYYLAMSLYNMENYPEAVGEFRKLLTAYPVSPFADDAQFQLGMCHFEQSPKYSRDQDETHRAIDEFTEFLNRYPQSPLAEEAREKLELMYHKLAKKMFKNGELYLKLNDYEPALLYFDMVRDNYPQTEWAQYALFYSGKAQMKLGHKSDALTTFQDFVAAFPDHKLAKKARENIEKLTRDEGGG
jgi:outer membrane protein assembly factor BamD